MVNEKVVVDTINRMLEAGIDDSTIISTLKDIGLDDDSAKNLLNKTKAGGDDSSSSSGSDNSPESKENYEDDDELNDLKNVKDELETQGQLRELHDATTHNMLNEHYDKINEISKEVENVKKSVSDSTARFNSQDFYKKPAVDSSSIEDLNAKIDALSSLMKQILEVNRKVLTELEMKK